MKAESYITTAAQARRHLGQRVFWDDVGNRYIFLRHGIIEDVIGSNVKIDGDYKMLSGLPGLRNFEMGGEWARNRLAE